MYLNGHSWFSLRFGVLSPKQLVAAAKLKGVQTLALTDINNTSASLEFVRACEAAGIRPALGIEFRRDGRLLYVGLARNRAGWLQLCRFFTDHSLGSKPLPDVAPALTDTYIIYTTLTKPLALFAENEFLAIRPAQVQGLFSNPLRKRLDKFVAWLPVTFDEPTEGFRMHKLLRAIDLNTLVTKLRPGDLAEPGEVFLPENEIEAAFQLFPQLLENARRLADDCAGIEFETGLQLNRRSFTGSKPGDFDLLQKLSNSGCERRYGRANRRARERIEKELRVIRELDFCTYFLITWDLVRYAQLAGYHHVGRGSGANSIVAYCIGITDVDPLELDLYFERFINPHRLSPPDFDVDFSWDERDDVTDYIFKRYGREHTALLATYSTFQMNALVRELGKAFGLPPSEIDELGDALPEIFSKTGDWEWSWGRRGAGDLPAAKLERPAAETPDVFVKLNPRARQILCYAARLKDAPNHLSIHSGGIIISEEPLNRATALQMMPKGFPVTHFDMYGAEDWGFHKFDVLSQRGLGHIKDAVELVRRNQGKAVDIHDIERIKNDPATRAQLRSGKCMGCFYIESPAMRGLLTKLRCDSYVHLVAASSIIRPGVAQSGMMRAYIQRFHSPNAFKSVHPVFREHLAETFEIMVYQEDVMKIVHHFAGLDLDESDVLRRMMTGKKRSSEAFERLKRKYFDNCRARGYPDELTNEVWRQIESFSGYSFCKAHSASFAVESFQSLYLKAHFPLEFMVGVINNFGGFYSTEFYVHELRRAGATVHPPCVNRSEYLTSIANTDVWLGLVHLKGLGERAARDLIEQRRAHDAFRSLTDFVRRVNVRPEDLVILIRIGAFRFTGSGKYALMWEKNAALGPENSGGCRTGQLFADENEGFALPELAENDFDQAFDELELLGFSLRPPFDLLQERVGERAGLPRIFAQNLLENAGKRVELLGYFVVRKDVRTKQGKLMHFGTWLDGEGAFFDTTHFPTAATGTRFSGRGLYRLWGRVVLDFGFPGLEVEGMERLPILADARNG